MSLVDVDYNEFYVTIKDYFSNTPYITQTGLTSQNLQYESCTVHDSMYEPKNRQPSTATIRLPSHVGREQYRELYSNFKEGCRVEIYNFQPDCGAPYFAGYIPINGITEEGGQVVIAVEDSLVQGTWQHLKLVDEDDKTPDLWYRRAIQRWQPIINEDFADRGAALGRYTASSFSPAPTISWLDDGVKVSPATGDNTVGYDWTLIRTASDSLITASPGAEYQIEVLVTFFNDGHIFDAGGSNASESTFLDFGLKGSSGFENFTFEWGLQNVISSPIPAVPTTVLAISIGGADTVNSTTLSYFNTTGSGDSSIATYAEGPTVTHLFTARIRFSDDGTSVSATWAVDGSSTFNATAAFNYGTTGAVYPFIAATVQGTGQYIQIHKWRVRKLVPYMIPGGTFVPQTSDGLLFTPNQEDYTSFLEFLCENDGTEMRIDYATRLDKLNIDAVGNLGADVSAELGYDAQPLSTTATSPSGAGTEIGNFAETPPFRFEEGHNLAAIPARPARAIAHGNEILQSGSGQLNSQLQALTWDVGEQGNPAASISPTYPIFEVLSSDNRAAEINTVRDLATTGLDAMTDPTPAFSLEVLDAPQYAGKWRAGDYALVKTLSLVTNVEESMRIMEVELTAGDPVKRVTMGRGRLNSDLQALLSKDMILGWLYDQSSQSSTILPFPYVGSIPGLGVSSSWTFPLDQFTTGVHIISAKLRWFSSTGAPVSNLSAVLNGTALATTKSGTDSGDIDITAALATAQTYTLQFSNSSGTAKTLVSAFVTVRIKI